MLHENDSIHVEFIMRNS